MRAQSILVVAFLFFATNTFGFVPISPSTRVTARDQSPISYQNVHLSQTANAVAAELPNYSSSIPAWKAKLTKMGMITFIAGMCLTLPLTLLPQQALYKIGLIDRLRKEAWAVRTAGFCARWVLRLVPFTNLNVVPSGEQFSREKQPVPSIWVCNHISMLDVFMLLAADKRLRGRHRRPIKIVYWKQLEDNPVTKLMFTQAGFISVDMQANGSGTANEYDKSTFKTLLKDCKQAFAEGYDIGLLPEGQLNPTPEKGLLPVFSGAYTLAKMSRRPIQFMALHGAHKLWHPDDSIGMTVTDNTVTIRCYPYGRPYESADEFKTTFETVVGKFGATGHDLPIPELKSWLTGRKWKKMHGGPPQFQKRATRRDKAKESVVEEENQEATTADE